MNLDNLETQLEFLKNDLEFFDSNPHYAVRIATIIRVLIHDTANSVSLLNHLELKGNLQYLDSAEEIDKMPIDNFSEKKIGIDITLEEYLTTNSYRGLTAEHTIDSNVKLVPFYKHLEQGGFDNNGHLLQNLPWKNFDEWWNSTIYKNSAGTEVSRSYLVLKAANKDGGAHYDSTLPQKYLSIRDDNIEWPDGYLPETIINSPLYPSIAQIGWEILKSIELRKNH